MSITDELRKYARGYELTVNHKLLEIADRIDAEHKKEVDSLYDELGDELGRKCKQVERLQAELDASVKLPVDADGVQIRNGDEMTDGEYTFVVNYMSKFAQTWRICDCSGVAWAACDITHHHEPTVKDVLRKFYEDFDSIHGYGTDEREVVGKYADLLQIKEADE